MTDHIHLYIRSLATRGFSERTLETYSEILRGYQNYLNKRSILIHLSTKRNARQYSLSLIDKGLNPITINHRIIIVRAFFNWLKRDDYRKGPNPFDKIDKRPEAKLLPVFCHEGQIKLLYKLVEEDNSIRVGDITMFDCFFSTGIRTSELCNLKEIDISETDDFTFLKIRSGKGNKDREVIMQRWGWDSLKKHLIGVGLRGFKGGWVFPNQHGNKMLRQDVYKTIRKIIGKVKDKKMGAHTIRHTYATYLMNNDTPIKGIQIQLGHSTVATTQRYLHLDTARIKAVYDRSHPKK